MASSAKSKAKSKPCPNRPCPKMGFTVTDAVPAIADVRTGPQPQGRAGLVNSGETTANAPLVAPREGRGVVVDSLIWLITPEHSNIGAETDTPCPTAPILIQTCLMRPALGLGSTPAPGRGRVSLAWRIEAKQMESSDLSPSAPRVLAAPSGALAPISIERRPCKTAKFTS
jgi:hypothetical protein